MAVKNRRTLELKLGKTGIIVFVCVMSALLFGVFLLGIVVGKHMEAYPEKYSAGMKDLIYDHLFASASREGKGAQPVETGGRRDGRSGVESPSGKFPDTPPGKKGAPLPDSSAPVAKEQPPEISTPPPVMAAEKEQQPLHAAETGAIGKKEVKAATAEKAVEKAVEKAKPPADRRPDESGTVEQRAAGSVAAPPAVGQYEIQVAAYQDRRKADQMVGKLNTLGYSAEVVRKEISGKGAWFRVIVGGFGSREKAKAASDTITGNISGIKCTVRPSENSHVN